VGKDNVILNQKAPTTLQFFFLSFLHLAAHYIRFMFR